MFSCQAIRVVPHRTLFVQKPVDDQWRWLLEFDDGIDEEQFSSFILQHVITIRTHIRYRKVFVAEVIMIFGKEAHRLKVRGDLLVSRNPHSIAEALAKNNSYIAFLLSNAYKSITAIRE